MMVGRMDNGILDAETLTFKIGLTAVRGVHFHASGTRADCGDGEVQYVRPLVLVVVLCERAQHPSPMMANGVCVFCWYS